MVPASEPSLMVREPSDPDTSNSAKSMTVPALDPMVPVVMAITLVPAFRALTMS